jgi:hypothetical protein
MHNGEVSSIYGRIHLHVRNYRGDCDKIWYLVVNSKFVEQVLFRSVSAQYNPYFTQTDFSFFSKEIAYATLQKSGKFTLEN